jgi:hypothetical protein
LQIPRFGLISRCRRRQILPRYASCDSALAIYGTPRVPAGRVVESPVNPYEHKARALKWGRKKASNPVDDAYHRREQAKEDVLRLLLGTAGALWSRGLGWRKGLSGKVRAFAMLKKGQCLQGIIAKKLHNYTPMYTPSPGSTVRDRFLTQAMSDL